MKRRGFTLVELLTVTAILSVLAALLAPVLAAARWSARSVECIAHLRSHGAALQLYGTDADGALPWALSAEHHRRLRYPGTAPYPVDAWNARTEGMTSINDALEPYGIVAAARRCGMDRMDPLIRSTSPEVAPTYFQEYGSSYDYDDFSVQEGRTLDAAEDVSRFLLVLDAGRFHGSERPGSDWRGAFADGHAASLTGLQIGVFFRPQSWWAERFLRGEG